MVRPDVLIGRSFPSARCIASQRRPRLGLVSEKMVASKSHSEPALPFGGGVSALRGSAGLGCPRTCATKLENRANLLCPHGVSRGFCPLPIKTIADRDHVVPARFTALRRSALRVSDTPNAHRSRPKFGAPWTPAAASHRGNLASRARPGDNATMATPDSSAVLRNYLQTALGATASPELVARLQAALAPDCLGPVVRTVDHVHTVRGALEQMDAVRTMVGVGESVNTAMRTECDQTTLATIAVTAKMIAHPPSAPARSLAAEDEDEDDDQEDEHHDEEHERELVQRELSDSALSPATIQAVIAELVHISDHEAIESYWLERSIMDGGLSLAAANAARRAYQRVGGPWQLIDLLDQYLVPHASPERAKQARLILAQARRGEAVFHEDEIDARNDAANVTSDESDESPIDRCLAKVELLAHETIYNPECIAYYVAYEIFQIAHVLADEVSRGAAQELVAAVEALGAEQR